MGNASEADTSPISPWCTQGPTVLQGLCWSPEIEGVLGHPVFAHAPSAAACGSGAGTSISLEPFVVK